jgi:PAS domain S-box-containing protein
MMSLRTTKYEKKFDRKIDPQLRVLFDNSDEFKVCMLDAAGSIIGWNYSAERMTGFSAAEVLGKNYSMFISKEEAQKNVLTKALSIAAHTGQFIAEGIRIRKDGSHFWARSYITPIKNRDGLIKFFVLITRNIMREREIDEKREEYIGIASHELKTPITTLSLYADLLGKRLEIESDKKNLLMLRDIQGQTLRLVALVDDLLIVSKIEGGTLQLHPEVFNPNAYVQKLVREFQISSRTHKIVCTGSFSGQVRADRARIAQVVINLLSNAVKYSPRANKIQIHIGRSQKKCLISVQDFGAGISKKDQRDIFTRFFRAEDAEGGNIAGAGLGLYIAKEIMKAHRERLWVQSVEGRGATFSFTLPSSS